MISTLQIVFFYSYGIPLFLINLRIVFVLWRYRSKFDSAYFKIFSLAALNDVVLYIANNLMFRLPNYKPLFDAFFSNFTEFSFYLSPIMFITIFCSFGISFFTFVLSLNRLTSVCKYASHEWLWEKSHFYWLSFVFVGPFLLGCYPLLSRYRYVVYKDGNDSVVMLFGDPIFSIIDYNQTITVFTIFIFISTGLVTNVMTIVVWRRRKTTIPRKYHSFEWKLIVLTAVIYFLQVISLLYNLLAFEIESPNQGYLLYGIISDSVSLIPDVAIIFVSPSLRVMLFPKFMKRLFNRPKKQRIIIATITNTPLNKS